MKNKEKKTYEEWRLEYHFADDDGKFNLEDKYPSFYLQYWTEKAIAEAESSSDYEAELDSALEYYRDYLMDRRSYQEFQIKAKEIERKRKENDTL